MARPNQDAIDTFISISGAPEVVAIRLLEEHGGNLNEAVNAHFGGGDRYPAYEDPAAATRNDFMDIDDPLEAEPHGIAPIVSQPREVRRLPIEVKNGSETSASSGPGPRIENVTDIERVEGQEVHGTAIIDDEDENDQSGHTPELPESRPSARVFGDIPDSSDDIEEQMIRAAIEASKKDIEVQNKQNVAPDDLNQQWQSHHEVLEELGKITEPIGRSISGQGKEVAGSSSVQDEFKELEEPPLVTHRRRSSGSAEAGGEVEQTKVSSPSSPPGHAGASQPQLNGNTFHSDEWGGISSVEHDEAVMLEAAMFGGIFEDGGYGFAYTPHQLMQSGLDRARQTFRPPSPGLAAQRAIREQQDDEYLASLQADREKELKAMEEEKAARQAALEEQKRKEEEYQQKLEEEQELERQLAEKEASLPEEPTLDDENAITLLVRMPDGSRHGRRFLKSHKLQFLFDFIDIGRAVKPGSYRLARPYPRRAFSDRESNLTLSELGLTSKQEALFLELI